MTALTVVLLFAGVAGALMPPSRLPAASIPVAAAVAAVASGGLSLATAGRALDPLRSPIGFLLAAVPLAVLLERLGFFSSLAAWLTRSGRGAGGLWALAALATTVFNLDASVVLLTPLYVRIARRQGWEPLTLAYMPVLLACLASSALPVSNLTNLIVASATGASTAGFVAHLGLPSLVATLVGWLCFRRLFAAGLSAGGTQLEPLLADGRSPARPLAIGGAVVAAVLIGFTLGPAVGAAPWMVALGADVVLMAVLKAAPWRHVPAGTALIVASLGVLAAAAAGHLPIGRLLAGHGTAAIARTSAVAALAANVVNNLPALLVALPSLGHRVTPAAWAVLVGVNMGPVLLVTGSLASLLWMNALGRLGVQVSVWDFTRTGVLVGLPAAVAGLATHLAMHAAGIIA
ncbi:MAG: SLC13 family permease [Acidimicrobiales bacterium]